MKNEEKILQMTHIYAHFCGYCFWSVSTYASVSFLSICSYYNNVEKPYREKRRILFGMRGSIDRQKVWEYFWTKFFGEKEL